MQLPRGTIVVVADGTQLHMFRNSGDESHPRLAALEAPALHTDDSKGDGAHHHSSAANPNDSRLMEDSFAAVTADYLNRQVTGGKIDHLVVIAAPKTLGELRKHFNKQVQEKLVGELAKELTGHTTADIERALMSA